MSFVNVFFIFLLPLSLLPLLTLFIKTKPQKFKIVSWLMLFRDSKLERKRSLYLTIIILIRIFILALIILFLSKPVPSKYKFDKILIEKSVVNSAEISRIRGYSRSLKGFFGKRVEHVDIDELKEFCKSPWGEDQRAYIICSPFWISDLLSANRNVFWDTLTIKNAGIIDVEAQERFDSIRITFINYNLPDSVFEVRIESGDEMIYTETFIMNIGETKLKSFPLTHNLGSMRIRLVPQDDVLIDNEVDIKVPSNIRSYFIRGENRVLDLFFSTFLRKAASPEEADIIVSVNEIPQVPNKSKVLVVFTNSEKICEVLGVQVKRFKDLQINGLNLNDVLTLRDTVFNAVEDLIRSSIKKITSEGREIIIVGTVPDLRSNKMLYYPAFWSLLLRELRPWYPVCYTYESDRIGKIVNDTLFLLRLQEDFKLTFGVQEIQKNHLSVRGLLTYMRNLRTIFLSVLFTLVMLELFLYLKWFH